MDEASFGESSIGEQKFIIFIIFLGGSRFDVGTGCLKCKPPKMWLFSSARN